MTESQLRDEICRVGASLFARGYVHATAGNISVRLNEDQGGGFLITPTDACLGYLEPSKLALLTSAGQQIAGDRASKTIALHRRIYETTAATGRAATCVIHTHSTHLVALTLRRERDRSEALELIPPITPYFVMKVGHVPWIRYQRPGAESAANDVASAITQYAQRGLHLRAVMLDKLGPNVWHDSLAQVMATLEELEETAKLMCLSPCPPSELSAASLQELQDTFGASW